MTEQDRLTDIASRGLPFPLDWIRSQPRKVEEILASLSVEEQARCLMQLSGRQKMDLLMLMEKGPEVTGVLPPEEVYQMVKTVGEDDAEVLLAMVSFRQLQYIFDLEWWSADAFQPLRALDWINRLERYNEEELVRWFLKEEFNQQVMFFQAFIRVFKRDEGTDSYEGVEELEHFSPDGVYDIFFKVPGLDHVKRLLLVLRGTHPEAFINLMEAVIWYPVTPTVEKAYQWRMTRTAEHGIPPFEEAVAVYSRMNPDQIQVPPPEPEDFFLQDEPPLAPQYPLAAMDPSFFFSQCLARIQNGRRQEAIRWEVVNLANKVMVADRRDPFHLESRHEVLRKVVGYVNLGLELAADGTPEGGTRLLERTWLQFLFQAGYQGVMELKWKAERLLSEHGPFLDGLLTPGDKEQMSGLVGRFPQVGVYGEPGEPFQWRNFETRADVGRLQDFLDRWSFFVRFSKQCLDLSARRLNELLERCAFPRERSEVHLMTWTTTAFANFLLFKEVSPEPLTEPAARSFLELIFLPRVFQDESRVVNPDRVQAFHRKLLSLPMAWTEDDRRFLQGLLQDLTRNLEGEFGRLDPQGDIEWKYTRGLCLQREPRGRAAEPEPGF